MAYFKRGVFLSLNMGANSVFLGGLIDFLKHFSPDLVMLQEVTVPTDQLDSLVKKLGYAAVCNVNVMDERSIGTAVVYKGGSNTVVINVEENRLQKVVWNGIKFLNVYAPSGSDRRFDRRKFFGDTVPKHLREILPIILGDMNCITDEMDTERNAGNKLCPMLGQLIETYNLKDGFRILYPNKREYTFFRKEVSAARLDRVYVPNSMANAVFEVEHLASLSDHKLVRLEMHFKDLNVNEGTKPKRGSSFWKMNSEILNETDFWTNFNILWENLVKAKRLYADTADWWERRAKPEIRKLCISYSKDRAVTRRDTVTFLYLALDLALIDKNWERVNFLKNELKRYHRENAMGVIIRSKFNENAEMERASLFHVGREMRNGEKNSLNKMVINGKVEDDRAKIEEEVMRFFFPLFNGMHGKGGVDTGNTFQQDDSNLREFLDPLTKLTDEQRDKLEEPINFDELVEIMKGLPKSKSPGLDGLPYEFYVKAFSIIGRELFEVYNCILRKFKLIESMMNGATRLAPKVKGVPKVNELRPITLLQCDYKILTKIFVGRLLEVLPDIIKSGQLCSVQGKSILSGVSNLLSTLQYVSAKELNAAIISLDQWKAYDRVYIKFLLQVMEAMGFGPIFVGWIKMLHTGNKTRFILNELSNPIKILFSVRQGDPIAMLLYIIYLEPLLIQLKNRLKGVCLGNIRHNIEAYVDDVNICVTDESDFETIDEIFDNYEAMSGALLNRDAKSKIMGLGGWTDREVWPLRWLKVEKMLKIFGFLFVADPGELSRLNWSSVLEKFKKVVWSWSSRLLDTLAQRVEILKIFATSKLWYISHILELPNNVCKQLEAVIGTFIWYGCLERLPIDEIKNPPRSGGLGLVCVSSKALALRLKHFCKILASPEDDMSYRKMKYWLGQSMGRWLPKLLPGPHFEAPPLFYRKLREDFVQNIVGVFEMEDLDCVTSKTVYAELTSTLPPPKIETKLPLDPTIEGANWDDIWTRLCHPVMEVDAKNVMFKIVNDILPTKQRLFRLGKRRGPFCEEEEIVVPILGPLRDGVMSRESMVYPVGGPVDTPVHMFCECRKVAEQWFWVRRRILDLCRRKRGCSNFELLNLIFPKGLNETDITIVWLISSYVKLIWFSRIRGSIIKVEELRAQMKTLHNEHNRKRTHKLDEVDWG